MTSAEFKTTRQILGMSSKDFANYIHIEPRTIQRMENGQSLPKDFAVDILNDLYLKYKLMLKNQKQTIDFLLKNNEKRESIILIRYKNEDFELFNPDLARTPPAIHSTVIGRLKEYIETLDITVKIIYFDPILYREWKGERKDSRELRSSWAALAYYSVDTVKAATENGQKENRQ